MYGIVVHLVVQIRWEVCSKASFISFSNSVWPSVDSAPKMLMDPNSFHVLIMVGASAYSLLRLQQCCPPNHIAFSLIFLPSALTLLPKWVFFFSIEIFYFIEVQLIYNVVLISGIQQSIQLYIYIMVCNYNLKLSLHLFLKPFPTGNHKFILYC